VYVRAARSVRVVVVEDFDSFCRFVCSELEQRPELRVICEVSDGQEAVHKAREMRPDLILLDIGVPTLNFLSQETSADIVQQAMRLGAWGYVFKARAAHDLLPAIDAVLSGTLFVSGQQLVGNT
jgi:DNA-binding NarL/FixJ family response regulator